MALRRYLWKLPVREANPPAMSHVTSYTMSLQYPPPSNPGPADVISFFCPRHECKKFAARFGAVLIHSCGAIVGIRANRIVVGSLVNEALSSIREEIPECGSWRSRWATPNPREVGGFCRRQDLDRDWLFIHAVSWHSQ